MINEGRGISDINKIETENIFNLFKSKGISDNIYIFDGKRINIIFNSSNTYDSVFGFINNKMFLSFGVPDNPDLNKIKETITHELTHLIEINAIVKKKINFPQYNKIKQALLLFSPKTPLARYFKQIVYLTLDNEVNANVSQTYTYLRNFDSKDKNLLLRKLKEYPERLKYEDILNVDTNMLIKHSNEDNDALKELIHLNKLLIDKGSHDFYNFISSNNVEILIKNWVPIMKKKVLKMLDKQIRIVDEVIKDINETENYTTKFPFDRSAILTYEEYLKAYK